MSNMNYTHPKGKGAGKYNGMKKAGDWEGKTVRATRQVRNNGGNGVMPGTIGKVESVYAGLRVTFNKCKHCGSVLHVSNLDYHSVELAEAE